MNTFSEVVSCTNWMSTCFVSTPRLFKKKKKNRSRVEPSFKPRDLPAEAPQFIKEHSGFLCPSSFRSSSLITQFASLHYFRDGMLHSMNSSCFFPNPPTSWWSHCRTSCASGMGTVPKSPSALLSGELRTVFPLLHQGCYPSGLDLCP